MDTYQNTPISLENTLNENGKNIVQCDFTIRNHVQKELHSWNRYPQFSSWSVGWRSVWLLGLIFCVACGSKQEESVPPPTQPLELLPPLNVSEASPQTALRVLLNEELPGSQEDSDTNTVIRMPRKAFNEEDIAQVLPSLRRAAEGGMPNAQYILGMCDYLGRGTPHDVREAIQWFQKAADQNEPQSQCMLGICYYYGEGAKRDQEKAFTWFQKAADQDLLLAQFCLGICYYDGTGVAQDRTLALEYFKRAANQGHVQAQYMVSTFASEPPLEDMASAFSNDVWVP